MDENEQEFIEDFGAKSAPNNDNAGGVPVPKRPTTAAKRQGTARSTKRGNVSP